MACPDAGAASRVRRGGLRMYLLVLTVAVVASTASGARMHSPSSDDGQVPFGEPAPAATFQGGSIDYGTPRTSNTAAAMIARGLPWPSPGDGSVGPGSPASPAAASPTGTGYAGSGGAPAAWSPPPPSPPDVEDSASDNVESMEDGSDMNGDGGDLSMDEVMRGDTDDDGDNEAMEELALDLELVNRIATSGNAFDMLVTECTQATGVRSSGDMLSLFGCLRDRMQQPQRAQLCQQIEERYRHRAIYARLCPPWELPPQ